MPILVMGLLALAVFGFIGILLTVAVALEHSTLSRTTKIGPRPTPSLNQNVDRSRGEDTPPENLSEKEKVHEHACT